MPSLIQYVDDGGDDAQAPPDHWIENDVVRIGSGPGTDLCIAGMEEHTVTIHFADGRYVVYNRTRRIMAINGTTLAPRESACWPNEAILSLNNSKHLRLRAQSDPAPEPRPHAVPPDLRRIDAPTEAAGFKQGWLFWLGPGVMAAVLALACLPRTPLVAPRFQFEHLLQTLERSGSAGRPLEVIAARLQEARAAELRGHRSAALQAYIGLRDYLLRLRSSGGSSDSADMRATLEFVRERLQVLADG